MRVALHSTLKPGMHGEYEREHAQIPDDLMVALQEVGVRDWQIWRSGHHLFHLVDVEGDFTAAMDRLDGSQVNDRWQAHMARFVEGFATGPDGTMPIRDVWSMARQSAGTTTAPERKGQQ